MLCAGPSRRSGCEALPDEDGVYPSHVRLEHPAKPTETTITSIALIAASPTCAWKARPREIRGQVRRRAPMPMRIRPTPAMISP
jgi:hypothetical protein